MDHYSKYIIAKIREAKAIADELSKNIGHRGIEGQIREIAIKTCIDPFLTSSFSSSSGKIIDTDGNLSRQIDIVVYHKKNVPPIFISPDLGFFPVESTKYIFEVKSTLTAEEIRDANKKFASVAGLNSKNGRLPVTVIMALASDINGSEIERYIKYSKEYSSPPCVVLCVLGKGYWWFQDGKWYGNDTSADTFTEFSEFTMFISGFMNTLSSFESSIIPFNPGSYISILRDISPDIINLK